MALQITDACLNCWACADVCPNDAIALADPHFLIDERKCTECLGDHAEPQCAAICPIEAAIVDESVSYTHLDVYKRQLRLEAFPSNPAR